MRETVTKLEEKSSTADGKNIDNVTNGDNIDGGDVKQDANDDDDSADTSATVAAAPVNVSHVGAIVAAVNVSTIVVIGVVIVVFRVIRARLGRRPRRVASPPPPCSLDRTSSMRRRQEMFGSVHYAPFDKTRSSTSSRIYDEIPAVPVAATSVDTPPAVVSVPVLAPVRLDNVAADDTSIYLTPVVSPRDRVLP
ncbi:hypothetical protein V1264_024367 [Littorina saxatilis]|uniref:Uncharacterized protein n=2 Tax=Littorina saxatilis TaxID=31220 RepID=A0AAN9ALL3_9CAEN